LIPVKDASIALMLARLFLHQGLRRKERDGLKSDAALDVEDLINQTYEKIPNRPFLPLPGKNSSSSYN
jgi:hypothetical protein